MTRARVEAIKQEILDLGLCQCGCGQQTRTADKTDRRAGHIKGQPLRYLHGHFKPPVRYGADNNRFTGGLAVDSDGRTRINCRDGSWMHYSRGVMAAKLGRLLTPDEIVHHVNGDPSDDRIENLMLTDRAEHPRLHGVGDRLCRKGLHNLGDPTNVAVNPRTGHRQCKPCHAGAQRAWREKNRERVQANWQAWYAVNRVSKAAA
jgi:hypothetical protein